MCCQTRENKLQSTSTCLLKNLFILKEKNMKFVATLVTKTKNWIKEMKGLKIGSQMTSPKYLPKLSSDLEQYQYCDRIM